MKTVFFNSFKERLMKGEVPASFWIDCFPVKDVFFTSEKFNTDDYGIENFRTLKELKQKGFDDVQFGYDQKTVYANYCCEYVTTPNFQYTTGYTKSSDDSVGYEYKKLASQLYSYQSAQMCYRFTEVTEGQSYKSPSAAIARGIVNYDAKESKFFVHYFNHPDLPAVPNFDFGNGMVNDGTTLYMGYVPARQELVNGLCKTGLYDGIYPIYGDDFRGFVFADTSGNLIDYVDFETTYDFDGDCFVYKYPETFSKTSDGVSANWAVFAKLE